MKHVFRSDEVFDSYQDYQKNGGLSKGCVLCDKEPIKKFKYWFITVNDFPYDRIAKLHNMLVPFRHVTESELTDQERNEFVEIKQNYLEDYDFLIEAAEKKRSVPKHFHIHLIAAKV